MKLVCFGQYSSAVRLAQNYDENTAFLIPKPEKLLNLPLVKSIYSFFLKLAFQVSERIICYRLLLFHKIIFFLIKFCIDLSKNVFVYSCLYIFFKLCLFLSAYLYLCICIGIANA